MGKFVTLWTHLVSRTKTTGIGLVGMNINAVKKNPCGTMVLVYVLAASHILLGSLYSVASHLASGFFFAVDELLEVKVPWGVVIQWTSLHIVVLLTPCLFSHLD